MTPGDRLIAAAKEALEWTRGLSDEDVAQMDAAMRAKVDQECEKLARPSYRIINGIRVYGPWEDRK